MQILQYITQQTQLSLQSVENTISLLNEDATIPFISRYRKEKTGNLDEVKIGEIVKFKEVFELRKNQFEDFIFSIVKDIEPQELNLPTFNRPEKKIVNNNKLWFEKLGLPTVQDTLFDGFKLKSETSLKETVIIPVKNGNYPCYVHSYPSDTGDDDFKYNVVNIVIEGIEGLQCPL